jgi:hypothetical protein
MHYVVCDRGAAGAGPRPLCAGYLQGPFASCCAWNVGRSDVSMGWWNRDPASLRNVVAPA